MSYVVTHQRREGSWWIVKFFVSGGRDGNRILAVLGTYVVHFPRTGTAQTSYLRQV